MRRGDLRPHERKKENGIWCGYVLPSWCLQDFFHSQKWKSSIWNLWHLQTPSEELRKYRKMKMADFIDNFQVRMIRLLNDNFFVFFPISHFFPLYWYYSLFKQELLVCFHHLQSLFFISFWRNSKSHVRSNFWCGDNGFKKEREKRGLEWI